MKERLTLLRESAFLREFSPMFVAGDEYYRQMAERLHRAMKGLGTDEASIYAVLREFSGSFGRMRRLKDAYRRCVNGSSLDVLETDLRSEMSGTELAQALTLLHAPLKPTGFVETLLAEVEREPAPGTPCTVASIKRYVRAYLDFKHLGGLLGVAERLRRENAGSRQYAEARRAARDALRRLLGSSLGDEYLDGGPRSAERVGKVVYGTLTRDGILGSEKGRRFYRLWQVAERSEEFAQGGVKALAESGQGMQLSSPTTGKANIKDSLWEEILRPGAIIQTWSTVDATRTFSCPASRRFGGVCGHSFILIEYAYSPEDKPPPSGPMEWPLFGGSGIPLGTGGENMRAKRNALSVMKDLSLVGMRIADQWGYHFIPRNLALINSVVPANHRSRVRWLADSEVWFAAQPQM